MPGAVCQQYQILAQIPNTCYLCTNNVKSTALNSSKQTHRYYHTHPNAEHVPKKIPAPKYQIHNDDHNTVGDDNGDGDDDV